MQSAVVSDLVRDSKLDATFHGETTGHVIEIAGRDARQRKIKQNQLWQRIESLGEGAYGTVWLEKLVEGKCTVSERAVKVMKKQVHKNVDYSRELEAIAKFSHPKYNSCFVESYGWFESECDVYIAMEYFPLGDLQGYLSAPFPESEVQQICFQVLEGLEFMHSNGFAHRDLKPSNLLVRSQNPDWWIKIGDFGISKRAEEGQTALRTFGGTVGFLAPEILVQNGLLDCEGFGQLHGYTVAVDIWSLGEIVFRALTTQSPFMKGLASYIRGTTRFPEGILRKHHVSPAGCDLVRNLLKPMPSDRPTAGAALLHSWIALQHKSSPKLSVDFSRLPIEQIGMWKREPAIGNPAMQQTQASMASADWSTIQAGEKQGEAESSSPLDNVKEDTWRPLHVLEDSIEEVMFSRLVTNQYSFEKFPEAFRLPENDKVVLITSMRIMLVSADLFTIEWEISWRHVESITEQKAEGIELRLKLLPERPQQYLSIPVRQEHPRLHVFRSVLDAKLAYDNKYHAKWVSEEEAATLKARDKRAAEVDRNRRWRKEHKKAGQSPPDAGGSVTRMFVEKLISTVTKVAGL